MKKDEGRQGKVLKERFINRRGVREAINGYVFIAPFLIGVIIFQIYVFASGFYYSFTDAQGLNPPSWIGLANYKQLIHEILTGGEFWRAIRVTFIYELGCLATQIPVAFVLAFVLNSLPFKKLQNILRAAFFVPVLINTIIVAWLFRQLFNPDQGLINWLLGVFGYHTRIDWLQNQTLAPILLIIVSFWQWTGFHMVYFVSQLQTIDPNLYEAAKIDGATPSQILLRITLPLMRPAVAYVMVTSAVGGLLVFDVIFMLFGGSSIGIFGPGNSAKALVPYIFDKAFTSEFRLGLASAAGWLTFLIIMIVNIFQMKVIGLGASREEE